MVLKKQEEKINKSAKDVSIGVDIGGTKINVGVINSDGGIISIDKFTTDHEKGPEFVINKICKSIEKVIDKTRLSIYQIRNIGIGIPGTIDSKNGLVLYAPNLNWRNIHFFNYFNMQFPFDIYLGQDTKAAVLAEYLFGAGRGCKNLVCLTIGTGIGSGIIINGKVYFGTYGTAGEIGHMIVKINGNKCNCGMSGCLEAHASGSYIANKAMELIKGNKKILNGKDVFVLAKKGNKTSLDIINEATEYLGISLVNVLNILGPEKIIISGGLSNENELIINFLDRFIKEKGYLVAAEKVKVVKAELGVYAPMVGAAMFYHDDSFKYTRIRK